MIRIILSALTILSLLTLGACNTMEGLGKDVQKVGAKIEQKADEKK